jgi:hypothetical protein
MTSKSVKTTLTFEKAFWTNTYHVNIIVSVQQFLIPAVNVTTLCPLLHGDACTTSSLSAYVDMNPASFPTCDNFLSLYSSLQYKLGHICFTYRVFIHLTRGLSYPIHHPSFSSTSCTSLFPEMKFTSHAHHTSAPSQAPRFSACRHNPCNRWSMLPTWQTSIPLASIFASNSATIVRQEINYFTR